MNVQAYFPEFQQSLTSSNWPSITQTTRIRDYSSLTQWPISSKKKKRNRKNRSEPIQARSKFFLKFSVSSFFVLRSEPEVTTWVLRCVSLLLFEFLSLDLERMWCVLKISRPDSDSTWKRMFESAKKFWKRRCFAKLRRRRRHSRVAGYRAGAMLFAGEDESSSSTFPFSRIVC